MSWVICGKSQSSIGSITELVLSEEKESVERTEMSTAQSNAGHHARSQLRMGALGGRDWSRPETGFAVRQDSEEDMKNWVPLVL